MKEEIFKALKDFTIKQSCIDDEPITRETRIYDDLGVYGGDAFEFILAFGRVFSVDILNFKVEDYFKSDGIGLTCFDKKKRTLTVGHLEKAILTGKLDEETINLPASSL